MDQHTIAIVGNPNCGKTTLFNQLTGSRQKVGNWSGVTVDKKTGQYHYKKQTIHVVDLPGTYSLSVPNRDNALDEYIACRYILSAEADLVVNIVDACNLRRHLYLTIQLLEMGVPCIIAVNMLDVAKQQDIDIDFDALSRELNCPVIPMVCSKNQGVPELQACIQKKLHDLKPIAPLPLSYPKVAEQAIASLASVIAKHPLKELQAHPRWLAIGLLERDQVAHEEFLQLDLKQQTEQLIHEIEDTCEEETDILMADTRYSFITGLLKSIEKLPQHSKQTFSHLLDKVIMHRIWGIPIFLLVMYLMFEFSMNIGTLLQPLFDQGSTTIFVDGVSHLGNQIGLPLWLTAIFAQGIGLGINTVITFVPQIGLLFLFLSFLEDSGYMARAAFVMDRFMQWVGLPGKSFIPLIVGFGCNVPSIMATRTLENRRDRILTAMMSPFMSCGARLAIFAVFGAAFFPEHGGLMVFLLYIIGIIIAMLTGFLMKKTLLRGDTAPFVLEIPVYHLPNTKTILILTWQRLRGFVIRAGKVIVPVCIIVGSLNSIQMNGTIDPNGSKNSLLSRVGQVITPVLHPMGVDQSNWPATVGLITGTLAKEVVIGTLNTLYTQTNPTTDSQSYSLVGGLKNAWDDTVDGFKGIFSATMVNPFTANEADHHMTQSAMGNMAKAFPTQWAAFAYLLFVLLYIPCVSTIGVIDREIGRGWAWLSTFWSFSIAYSVAVIFYQLSKWALHPASSFVWVVGLLLWQGVWFLGLRFWSNGRSQGDSLNAES